MKTTFQKISIQNFFSVGNTPIEIDFTKTPTTAVIGKNGEGKSSCILDAIHFALYGKPFRNINIPNVINSINNKDCMVEVWFNNGKNNYHIKRGLKPKVFEIYENAVLLDQDAAFKDYQKYLETTILHGMVDSVFRQIVVVGSADYKPFMQLSAAARREVIEELLDITVFSSMMTVAKEKISIIKETLTDIENSLELTKEKIKIHEDNVKRIHDENDIKRKSIVDQIEHEKLEVEKERDNIKKLTEKKQAVLNKITEESSVRKNLKILSNQLIKHQSEVENKNKEKQFFSDNDSCPMCKQNIPHDHKQNITVQIDKEIKTVEEKSKSIHSATQKLEDTLEVIEKNLKLVTDIDNTIFQLNTSIQSRINLVQKLNKNLTVINKSDKVNSSDIKKLQAELVELNDKRLKNMDDKLYHEIAMNLLKDGGIKTKIIKKYIPLINKYINLYLDKFGGNMEFTLDESFNEVIKSRYHDKYQYNNFSEGEKQRIDLAILLTWRHIAKIKNTLNTNLLIFDEIFDKSLDNNATEALLEILLDMDKDQNIFVISHRNDLSTKLNRTLKFEKVKNFTKVA
jgi:DNA repair exonuclease SbcCD ATPase subunit